MSEQVTQPRDQAVDEEELTDAESIVAALRDITHAERERAQEHDHHWEFLSVNRPDTPQHPRLAMQALTGTRTTLALLRCDICLLPATVILSGDWTEDQVRGVANATNDTPTD